MALDQHFVETRVMFEILVPSRCQSEAEYNVAQQVVKDIKWVCEENGVHIIAMQTEQQYNTRDLY